MNAIPVINLFNKPCYSQIDDQDWDILARHWYPVARIQDVSTQPQQVTLLDVKLALYKTESGDIHLVRDLCPHRGVPLTKGWVSGENLVCPYHGLHYNGQGKCIKIPAQPELTSISERFSLTKFPAVQKYGLIWTSIFSRDEAKANLHILPGFIRVLSQILKIRLYPNTRQNVQITACIPNMSAVSATIHMVCKIWHRKVFCGNVYLMFIHRFLRC